ncbi:hypothetical protein H2201_004857 [Coniosporium apollinis]|uniref:RRM domain-containing protein n=1 Tax=Coniosporium apollinis TaxID=61459 RepID=A0ABQ9NSU5_9PEZI|nr:hypothetical protein H2201_004857 [Coniosporium apollinis]
MATHSSPYSAQTNASYTEFSPTTNATAFSPEIVRGTAGQGFKGPPQFAGTNNHHGAVVQHGSCNDSYDPFHSTRPPSYDSIVPNKGLSASANAFRPTSSQPAAPVSYLTKDSVPDDYGFVKFNKNHGHSSRPVTSGSSDAIGSRPVTSGTSGNIGSRPTSSSTNGLVQGLTTSTHFGGNVKVSRYIKVTVSKEELSSGQAESLLRPRPSFKACINMTKRVLLHGELYFAFDTISSAQEAADDMAMVRSGEWIIEFITLKDFSMVSVNRPEYIDDLEGQVILWAHGPFEVVQNQFLGIQQMLFDLAASYGKILGRISLADDIPHHWQQEVLGTGILVEFDSLADGKRFFNAHKDAVYDGCLWIAAELPGGPRPLVRHAPPRHYHDSEEHANNRDNRIDLRRIQAGQDVRTTVMLRNIPNKMRRDELKGLLDEKVRGLYDFMYLRMDFDNSCNVGYAFINFVRSEDIVTFVKAFSGKPWQGQASNKIAEVSYATCQGREGLIAKFQNSGVMLQWPMYRPMLVYTKYDALGDEMISKEEPFPPPDNIVKVMRSMDSIQQVGLFPPNEGNRRGTRQRHQGPFDAGTPRALTYQGQGNQQGRNHGGRGHSPRRRSPRQFDGHAAPQYGPQAYTAPANHGYQQHQVVHHFGPRQFQHTNGAMHYHQQPIMDGHYDRFGNYHHGSYHHGWH